MKLRIYKLYTCLFLILPIICSYDFLPIDMLYVLGVVCAVACYSWVRNANKITISKAMLIYAFYVILSSVFPASQIAMIGVLRRLTGVIRFLIIFFCFFIGYKYLKQELLYKAYSWICVVVSVLIIVQYFAWFLGHSFTLIIPNVMINGTLSSNVYINNQMSNGRFSTFFLEPAHQAQYVLPCLALNIFLPYKNGEKINLTRVLLLSIGIIATTSMQGILGTLIIWTIYFMILFGSRNPKRLVQVIGLIILFVPILIYAYNRPIIQEQIYKKVSSFSANGIIQGTSSYLRLKVGWDCYGELSVLHKLLGTGYMYTSSFLQVTGIGRLYYSSEFLVGYMNGLSKMMFDVGIVGTLLFFMSVFNEIKGKIDVVMVGLLVCVSIFLLTCDCYEQLTLYLPLTIILNRAYSRNAFDNTNTSGQVM